MKALKGGMSGGTIASLKGQIDEMKGHKRTVFDPHSLGGTDTTKDLRTVTRDSEHGWIGPFVMATYNTRIVRRSSELLNYGPDFAYREVSAYSNPVIAAGFTAGLGALAGGLSFGPTRKVLDKLLPDPGEGPSREGPRERLLPDRGPLRHPRGEGRREGRPRLQGDRRDDGRERPVPRTHRRPRRRSHPRLGDG